MTVKDMWMGLGILVLMSLIGGIAAINEPNESMKFLLLGSGVTVGALFALMGWFVREVMYLRKEAREERERRERIETQIVLRRLRRDERRHG